MGTNIRKITSYFEAILTKPKLGTKRAQLQSTKQANPAFGGLFESMTKKKMADDGSGGINC